MYRCEAKQVKWLTSLHWEHGEKKEKEWGEEVGRRKDAIQLQDIITVKIVTWRMILGRQIAIEKF